MRYCEYAESVFIGTPTHICKRYCAAEFCEAVYNNAFGCLHYISCNSQAASGSSAKHYYSQPESPDRSFFQHCLDDSYYGNKDSKHKRIAYSMNFLREKFLLESDTTNKLRKKKQLEWFLSLESDLILGKDTIEQLVNSAFKYNASVLYSNCYPSFHFHKEPTEVDRITLGCTLIHRHVLEVIDFRYDSNILEAFPDAMFAYDCNRENFKMVYNPKIYVEHRNNGKQRGWETLPMSER